jgi:hypothetical protein
MTITSWWMVFGVKVLEGAVERCTAEMKRVDDASHPPRRRVFIHSIAE